MGQEEAAKRKEKKRMANFELLRILAMVMVVVMHFLSHSDSLIVLEKPLNGVRVLGSLLEAFSLVAVNTYLLLSGYLGVRSSFRPSKAVSLLCQIWFYALLIPLILKLFGVPTASSELGIYGLVQYLFPIETEHYWFATSYFMLYLLTPMLNKAAVNLTKRQFGIVLSGLLILFSGIKSISPVVFVFDRYGYDLAWFICVYLVGAYLGLYGGERLKKSGWLLYVGSALLGFGVNLVMYFICQKWNSFSYYFTVPFHYNFFPCLTGAVGLLFGFSGISIKESTMAKIFRRMGGLSFGIYLLHEHIDLRERWYGWLKQIVNPAKKEGILIFLGELIFCTVLLFAVGILIDWIRDLSFGVAGSILGKTKLSRKLKELDASFKEN